MSDPADSPARKALLRELVEAPARTRELYAINPARKKLEFDDRALQLLAALQLHGTASVSELASTLALSPENASRILGQLRKQKLVNERPDRDDRRRRHLSLSPSGRRVVERLVDAAASGSSR
jgi:DNA-binding MarR family transcriptional regulator